MSLETGQSFLRINLSFQNSSMVGGAPKCFNYLKTGDLPHNGPECEEIRISREKTRAGADDVICLETL